MAAGRKTGGRQKGSSNKLPAQIKDMILVALKGAGGAEYFQRQAEQNPAAFMSLVGKIIPLQLEGGEEPIRIIEITERIVGVDR